MFTVEQIARICHEANRAVQAAQQAPGIPVAAPWDDFPEGERQGVIEGVKAAQAGARPAALHESWRIHKEDHGWTYGPVKDADARTHPCMVPYHDLPPEQRAKDRMFTAIVQALS